jgi:hypothetical protein
MDAPTDDWPFLSSAARRNRTEGLGGSGPNPEVWGMDGYHRQPQFGDILEFFRVPFMTLLQRRPRLLTVA